MEILLAAVVAAPGLFFLLLAGSWLLARQPGERVLARLSMGVNLLVAGGAAAVGWQLLQSGASAVKTPEVHWFQVGNYHFEVALFVDRLSWPLVMLTSLLVGIVGVFSTRYLHRDRGYFRFFLLLHLFCFGALLVFTGASFDLLLGGWELVGITSVLLIAFFDERVDPVRNAGRVFAYYRLSDTGLLVAIFLLHVFGKTSRMDQLFPGNWPERASLLSGEEAGIVALLLLMGAAGKSAQAPFSGWLPRAMEGPTPSSAIFYGAISVHLGAYLLLRAQPLLQEAAWAAGAVVAVGASTAVLATLVHRASTDAKTSLAYAGMAQLGIIFVEIGLGYPRLALAHIIGHAVVRTLQFLRAPSMLHDYHRVHAAAGGQLGRTGAHYDYLLPEAMQNWLYRAAMGRGYLEELLERCITGPVLRFARWCASMEPSMESGPDLKRTRRDAEVREPGSLVERREA